ncbi:hypothetical protein [Methylobacterium brachiatum]|uniref:hypothetical protein n=1 Tax=Methylobacterium brachiatum TaxID=269660 RepID=UPI00244BF4AD|nr:hypothetical protein [Methylobacterium brachiatum]MDH2313172.1 hypothetical protein [Methylobacterium brachiatum]
MIGVLFQAWAAFSPLASIVGASGIACVLVAFLGAMFVPERLKLPLIGLGALLIAGAAVWQAAEAKGAHDLYVAAHQAALRAEQLRAEKAEAITRTLAEQATRERAAARADTLKLKELTDALARDPRRDGVCVPRDLSRRLRAL